MSSSTTPPELPGSIRGLLQKPFPFTLVFGDRETASSVRRYGPPDQASRHGYFVQSLDEATDAAVDEFYRVSHGHAVGLSSRFGDAVAAYFRAHPSPLVGHDDFFNQFTPLWQLHLNAGDFRSATEMWGPIVEPVIRFEVLESRRCHKGSPFYYGAVAALLGGDIDRGFLFMHRAFHEDCLTHNDEPDTPTLKFLTLDGDNQNQLFYQWVRGQADALAGRLENYRRRLGRSLEFGRFRTNFMSDRESRESVFMFTHALTRFHWATPMVGLQFGTFGSQYVGNLLFDLCCVLEGIVDRWQQPRAGDNFQAKVAKLDRFANVGVSRLLGRLNTAFNSSFDTALARLVDDGVFIDASGTESFTAAQRSLAICYAIRNRLGHAPSARANVAPRSEALFEAVLDCIFLGTETLPAKASPAPTGNL